MVRALAACLAVFVLATVAASAALWSSRADLQAARVSLAVCDERARVAVVSYKRLSLALAASEAGATAFRGDVPGIVAEAVTAERGACAGLVRAAEARGRLDVPATDLDAVAAALRRARRRRK